MTNEELIKEIEGVVSNVKIMGTSLIEAAGAMSVLAYQLKKNLEAKEVPENPPTGVQP